MFYLISSLISGGQKQRVSLARAMYQDVSVYLLDSPLSAVDASVGNALFDNVIIGALRNKTVIFVTHQLELLPKTHRVIVMKNGAISEFGTYDELMAAGLNFAELMARTVQDKENLDNRENARRRQRKFSRLAGGAGQIIATEEKKKGAIPWEIYYGYAAKSGHALFITVFILAALEAGGMAVCDWWLSYWATHVTATSSIILLSIYLGVCAFVMIDAYFRIFSVEKATLRAARKLHDEMLERTLHSPLSFFDTTPVGRILNRFSKDTEVIDSFINQFYTFTLTGPKLIAVMTVISIVTPFFLVPLLPLSYLFYYLQHFSLNSAREVQRLEAVAKSPIYAQVAETLSGISTIRAFGATNEFITNNERKINKNAKALFAVNSINRWFSIRMELLCSVVVAFAAVFSVLERDSLDPGLAGLSVSYALITTQAIFFFVKCTSDIETSVVSVERVLEYGSLEQESMYQSFLRLADTKLPRGWPRDGKIEFSDFSLKYRPGLERVLHHLSFTIRPEEKIGIVGRTGSGKSSLFMALLRLVEADAGHIIIDKVDIANIRLPTLRSRIAIIPQDPSLFTGTVRSNLDPTESHTDAEVWVALESVHMKNVLEQLPEKLNSPVIENGENFSVGQRQLLCLGRALLRNTKILLMDEATASVDMETDQLIQQTIQDKFSHMTVLTIAHRLNTIEKSDRILVLDHGRIAEFDSPEVLSSSPNSLYSSLLREAKAGVH